MMKPSFNLVDEPWIPVANKGEISLWQVFSESGFRDLGGSSVTKIAFMKLLLAIGQAVGTPSDDAQWKSLGWQGLATRCQDYLEKWHDRFDLYGEAPFLQMPDIASAKKQSYGAVLPQIATGNTTVLTQIQVEQNLSDAQKARLLVSLSGFALGGKKTDNSVVLQSRYQGKSNEKGRPSTGRPGPSVAYMGLLHSFYLQGSIRKTVWANLLTLKDIEESGFFPSGVGIAPWEKMPRTEDCNTARELKTSFMGRLVSLCRFCFLAEDGLHYSEGLAHENYAAGIVDPTVSVDFASKKPRVLWTNPERRPWRELTSLLGFLGQQRKGGFDCLQLRAAGRRILRHAETVGVWSGGLRVSSNAGEQYVSGGDDVVASSVWLSCSELDDVWFQQLSTEMDVLNEMSKILYGSTARFYKEQKSDGGGIAAQAANVFWQLSERHCQELVDACDNDPESTKRRQSLRKTFAGYVHGVYDQYCQHHTARQVDAWAKHRPHLARFFKQEEK
jgi:CRISPR system Cascade subunit CasA